MKEGEQKTGHTLNNTPTMQASLLSARGSFSWTHNRTNEHMCHLIISTDAGKEAVMLPARCQE